MIIAGPSPVSVFSEVVTAPSAPVRMVRINLDGPFMSVAYGQREVTAAIPPALLTAIENRIKAMIEADQGWTAGTATLT